MNSTLIGKCKPALYSENGLFLFRARDYVDWEGDYDALLAIKGEGVQSDQIGSVSWIHLNRLHRTAVFNALKGRVPSSDTVIVESGTLIMILPRFFGQWVKVDVD